MSIVAAPLGSLLMKEADLNFCIQQEMIWSARQESNAAKLQVQTKYHTQWESAFDDAICGDKECKTGGVVYIKKDTPNVTEAEAERYANAKVKHYDEELSLELAELDMEYDTMKTMYETMLTSLRAQIENEKSLVQQNAQDTGLLQQ